MPAGGLFLVCPVCDAAPGQRCINVPGEPLNGDILHRQRVDVVEKVIEGQAALPAPLA
ncbi:zinc finger domain-containing protein [Micromonospora sp. DT68]